MLSADGCRERRRRFWERLDSRIPRQQSGDSVVLADPIHLMYLANFWVDPCSLGAGFGGFLVLSRGGHATLFHENRLPSTIESAHVDSRQVVKWYDGVTPAYARQLAVASALPAGTKLPAHDQPGHPLAQAVVTALAEIRRQKDPDELSILRRCMRVTEAGHTWARDNVESGMTELDVYRGVNSACIAAAGQPVIVYGDFAVSPGPERTGGPPTDRVLAAGDLFILDFSVVTAGYRSDFTATLIVDTKPTGDQRRMHSLCVAALEAGERLLRTGTACRDIYEAVRHVFEDAGVRAHFPHHAGHGLGLTHPEAPFLVRQATEMLMTNDVITLEPGLYMPDIGGIRIEHNYLITESGYERLSNHSISLK